VPDWVRYGLVAVIVLLTHFQEGVTGFGCTVLALPFITLLLGLKVAVPVLVINGWLLAMMLVLESRKRIVWKEFARIILLVGIGFPFGIWGSKTLPENTLKWVLAGFMIVVGTQGLVSQFGARIRKSGPGSEKKTRIRKSGAALGEMNLRTRLLTSAFLPLGGVIHGAFGSGGPLVVIYAARALTDKTLFRVTLCMVWTILNSILIAQWTASSALTPHIWKMTAFCLPFTMIGLVVGNHAHYRINEVAFRKMIYSVLIASGVVLVWSLIG
jgi:uncharacterized protein